MNRLSKNLEIFGLEDRLIAWMEEGETGFILRHLVIIAESGRLSSLFWDGFNFLEVL